MRIRHEKTLKPATDIIPEIFTESVDGKKNEFGLRCGSFVVYRDRYDDRESK